MMDYKPPKVLLACEESQTVTIEMRKIGIDAFSCDILPCSGGHPEWHIQEDVLKILNENWDMIIAFPPCTYLTNAGTRHFSRRMNTEVKVLEREANRKEAELFFLNFVNNKCERICIENPVGWMNSAYRKPDQIIHPYYFGEPFQKRTCLWLKNLPHLVPTNILPKPEPLYICQGDKCKGKKINWTEAMGKVPAKERSKVRSKTFVGIALAMAEQWGKILLELKKGEQNEQKRTSV